MDRLSSRPNFHARIVENVTGMFNLIDDMETYIKVSNPFSPKQASTVMNLKDPESAVDLRTTFGPRWEEAVPLPL